MLSRRRHRSSDASIADERQVSAYEPQVAWRIRTRSRFDSAPIRAVETTKGGEHIICSGFPEREMPRLHSGTAPVVACGRMRISNMKRCIAKTHAGGVPVSSHVRPELPRTLLLVFTGVLLGPDGVGLVRDDGAARTFAELGALLLFYFVGSTIPRRATRASRRRCLTGILKLGIAVGAVAVLLRSTGLSWPSGILIGVIIAGADPGIFTTERGSRPNAPATNRVQDQPLQQQAIVALVCLLLFPLGNGNFGTAAAFAQRLLVLIGIGGFFGLLARAPIVVRARKRETGAFKTARAAMVVLIIGTLFATSMLELPLAAGALLLGLTLGGRWRLGWQFGDVESIRRLGNAIFFVALGLLVDVGFVLGHLWEVAIFAGCLLLIKTLMAAGSLHAHRKPRHPIRAIAAWLVPIGAPGLLLFYAALDSGILNEEALGLPLGAMPSIAAVTLTMAVPLETLVQRLYAGDEGSARARRAPSRTHATARRFGSILKNGANGTTRKRLFAIGVAPNAHAVGKSIGELELQSRHGIHAISVWRNGAYHPVAVETFKLKGGDYIVLSGRSLEVARTLFLFEKDEGGSPRDLRI